MKLNNKVYDVLKYISLIVLDAIGVMYQSLADVWKLPYGTEIMKTCTIISIFIGALIGVSSYNYKKDKKEENDEVK